MKDKILMAVAMLSVKYGLKKFTVDEVAAELHISKKTLYQYFRSKDEMIQAYFDENIENDKQHVLSVLESNDTFYEKMRAIAYTNLRYRLPLTVLDDAKRFYPSEWEKFEELKQFKLDTIQKMLKQAEDTGILRSDVHFGILSSMIDRISDMFLDTDFLLENKIKATQAIDETLNIIMHGILSKNE